MKPDHHAKMAAQMKERLKVEELAENIDELEDVVENAFPVLLVTVLVSIFLLAIFLVRMYIRYTVENPSKNRMDGKTVLITGATSGLGKATAIELARKNARVLITGRDKIKVEAVARNIRKKTGNQHVNALVLDLANLRGIREFCEAFCKDEKYLHVLINNAAYMGPKAATDDNLERCFGVNYLGHFYLTYLLSDKLKKNAPSRVINVVSDSYAIGQLDFDDIALNKGYDVFKAYARSKYAMMLWNLEHHRRTYSSCIWTFAVHPGACATELLRNYPGLTGNLLRIVSRIMFKAPEDGCQTIVYLAVADGLREFSGKTFANCKVIKTQDRIKDKEVAKELWNISAHLCGFEPDTPYEEQESTEAKETTTPDSPTADIAAAAAVSEPKKDK
ncbi:retinol dehydrogenase 12-like [Biomphalaria glabrata]|uniref:Retinol dehydrogenase 12-like n=1 Tax=Biomphalaria glabrata TaxID=6526 RepID=A0A9W2YKI1_BIOGL|nr:retinol dehydrogenase 12-like [Biomphalaria glabrata]XP_055863194.1 retinol dehydrogenase 12-like [Biomphalaria glabrata]XP_055863195.1 retinol dehydrogenase 12-like [Biomphalaria glabrata]XP_055863196.1 retinol dehydrogenase 12-like [Biomphalaria glabrata]